MSWTPPATWPPAFLDKNAEAPGWLDRLPSLVNELTAQWALRLEPHFPHIEYNFVAPGQMADGTPCVFKLSRHLPDTRAEITALRRYGGDGACRLLAADEEQGALLTERLLPGTMLTEVAADDDDTATHIAADLLRRLWRPAPPDGGLISLDEWCAAFERNREALRLSVPGFPSELFRQADDLRADLLATTSDAVVLHGDMHHFNVLRAQREEWLAIDPKGLAGDRHFDVYQFLGNPKPVPFETQRRRLAIFCEELSLDRERANAWCFVAATLNACWDYEDGGPYEEAVRHAVMMLQL